MDSVIENTGFYDYINHIFSGLVLLIGASCLLIIQGVNPIISIMNALKKSGIENQEYSFVLIIVCLTIVLIVCFILGSLIHELYSALYEKRHENPVAFYKKRRNRKFDFVQRLWRKTNRPEYQRIYFSDESILNNKLKYNAYWKLAVELIHKKDPNIKAEKNKELVAEYYFAYCSYYNQVNDNHRKSEKLRDIEGLSLALSFDFLLLVISSGISLAVSFFAHGVVLSTTNYLIVSCLLLFAFLSIEFDYITDKSTKNRLKMTLAFFEVANDQKDEKEYIVLNFPEDHSKTKGIHTGQ